MFISVVLSTHNGARMLPRTLGALQRVDAPTGGFEVIVVDNASNDGTADIALSFAGVLDLRVVAESRRGKSFAINRGLADAQGALIVLTDDDVLPRRQWLAAYEEAARRHPESQLFAGQVRHAWDKTPPEWLARLAEEGRSYAGTSLLLVDGEISPVHVKGSNMALRADLAGRYRFAEERGVNFTGQKASRGGEDGEFARRVYSEGYSMRYVSEACVEHIVRREEVGLLPVLRRYYRIGRSIAVPSDAQGSVQSPKLFGLPRHQVRTGGRTVMLAGWQWVRGRRYEAASSLIDLAIMLGQSREVARLDRPQSTTR